MALSSQVTSSGTSRGPWLLGESCLPLTVSSDVEALSLTQIDLDAQMQGKDQQLRDHQVKPQPAQSPTKDRSAGHRPHRSSRPFFIRIASITGTPLILRTLTLSTTFRTVTNSSPLLSIISTADLAFTMLAQLRNTKVGDSTLLESGKALLEIVQSGLFLILWLPLFFACQCFVLSVCP